MRAIKDVFWVIRYPIVALEDLLCQVVKFRKSLKSP